MTVIGARRPNAIRHSASIAAKAMVTELRQKGREIVDFTIGEPDMDTPIHILEAAIRAMRDGQTHYTASNGIDALRIAVCEKFARENALFYNSSQIVVGSGAKQIIYAALTATINEGDEVVVPAPYWVSYPDMVQLNGGRPVIVPCAEETGFKLTPKQLEAAISPRTRWLILNSPNNPTGSIYTKSELLALISVLHRHPHVWLMTDEIYEHIVFDGNRSVSAAAIDPDIFDRTLTVNGVSKAYAMTGWRLGYAGGPASLIAIIVKVIAQSTTCASSVSQAAAVAALSGDQSCVIKMTAQYAARRERMVAQLDRIEGIDCVAPAGAFYVFPSVKRMIGRRRADGKKLESDVDVTHFLIDAAGVATLDGSAYGMAPYLRFSFATSIENIERGCAQIAGACAALSD